MHQVLFATPLPASNRLPLAAPRTRHLAHPFDDRHRGCERSKHQGLQGTPVLADDLAASLVFSLVSA